MTNTSSSSTSMRSLALFGLLLAAAGGLQALPATSVQESLSAVGGVHANGLLAGTPMDAVVAELRAGCASDDAVACIKYRVLSALDRVLRKDSLQVTDSVTVVRNSYAADESASSSSSSPRSEDGLDLVDAATNYLQRHDVRVQLPWGARVAVSPRALDQDKLDISLDFGGEEEEEEDQPEEVRGAEARHRKYRKRKGKLRRMVVPILVFILLKAMTLIPLALGVLGLKAWNALQLGFFSFVIAISLAVFQLCKKIAADQAPVAPLAAHVAPWDAHYAAARAFEAAGLGRAEDLPPPHSAEDAYPAGGAHSLAYSAH